MEVLWLDVRDKLFNFWIFLWGWGVVNNCFGVCPNSRICVSRATFSLGSIILYKARYIIKPWRQVLFSPPVPQKHGTVCAVTTALQAITYSYRTDLLKIYNHNSFITLCKITIFSMTEKMKHFQKSQTEEMLKKQSFNASQNWEYGAGSLHIWEYKMEEQHHSCTEPFYSWQRTWRDTEKLS